MLPPQDGQNLTSIEGVPLFSGDIANYLGNYLGTLDTDACTIEY